MHRGVLGCIFSGVHAGAGLLKLLGFSGLSHVSGQGLRWSVKWGKKEGRHSSHHCLSVSFGYFACSILWCVPSQALDSLWVNHVSCAEARCKHCGAACSSWASCALLRDPEVLKDCRGILDTFNLGKRTFFGKSHFWCYCHPDHSRSSWHPFGGNLSENVGENSIKHDTTDFRICIWKCRVPWWSGPDGNSGFNQGISTARRLLGNAFCIFLLSIFPPG